MDPTNENTAERLELIEQLKAFFATAPDGQQEAIKQHTLSSNDLISCVKWNDAFFISGTDIVRSLVFRFQAFGRPVKHLKKFEEGIFSDLRNLKPGSDAILEEPKSPFLDLLFQNNCIRTQKKQKVFYWYSVPHDRLFLDALERDLKREKMGNEPTTVAVAQPALTISLDTTQAMFDNVRQSILSELNIGSFCIHYHPKPAPGSICKTPQEDSCNSASNNSDSIDSNGNVSNLAVSSRENDLQEVSSASTIFGQFSLFEGSPTYKQRRRRVTSTNQQQQQQQQQQTPHQVKANSRGTNDSEDGSDGTTIASGTWRNDLSSSSNNNTDDDTVSNTTRHFDCPLSSCDKYFKRLEHMKRHLRTHTMERPYLCEICGKRFSRSDNLAQHKKTHERNKPARAFGWEPFPSSSRSTLSRTQSKKTSSSSKTSGGGVKSSSGPVGGYLSKSISKSFPTKSRNEGRGSSYSDSKPTSPYSSRSSKRSNSTTLRRSSLPASINSNRAVTRSRLMRRSTHQRRQPTYSNRSGVGEDVETELICESDWTQHDNVEHLKALQPELSISTTSSTTISSCDTSPTSTQLPTINIEDLDPYSEIQNQNQMEDTAMMMVEEFVPQENQYYWEDESASDWQRRVDWNQYSSPTESENYDTEDVIAENRNDQQESLSPFPNYYYLGPSSPYNHYDVSNTSSCLASPTLLPSFLLKTATTTASSSTATTTVNSPILRPSNFNTSSHYFSDDSPTITPSDALLQRH